MSASKPEHGKKSLIVIGEAHSDPAAASFLFHNLEHLHGRLNYNVLALEFPQEPGMAAVCNINTTRSAQNPNLIIDNYLALKKTILKVQKWIDLLVKSGRLDFGNLTDEIVSKLFPRQLLKDPELQTISSDPRVIQHNLTQAYNDTL